MIVDKQPPPLGSADGSSKVELTNTLTEFNRERNLNFIVRLAYDLSRKRGEKEVCMLVVGASHQEMVSLANKAYQLQAMRYSEGAFTLKLVGLNYNPNELQIADPQEFSTKIKEKGYSGYLLEKYQMLLHDMSKTPYDDGKFHAVLINNVFVHYPFDIQKIILANAAQSLVPGGYFSMEEGRGLGYLGDKGTKRYRWEKATEQLRGALETGELGFSKLTDEELQHISRYNDDAFGRLHQTENYYRLNS